MIGSMRTSGGRLPDGVLMVPSLDWQAFMFISFCSEQRGKHPGRLSRGGCADLPGQQHSPRSFSTELHFVKESVLCNLT
ncbi:unnamed protein product [Boreogadus saida]